jgi:hypothetical protein
VPPRQSGLNSRSYAVVLCAGFFESKSRIAKNDMSRVRGEMGLSKFGFLPIRLPRCALLQRVAVGRSVLVTQIPHDAASGVVVRFKRGAQAGAQAGAQTGALAFLFKRRHRHMLAVTL